MLGDLYAMTKLTQTASSCLTDPGSQAGRRLLDGRGLRQRVLSRRWLACFASLALCAMALTPHLAAFAPGCRGIEWNSSPDRAGPDAPPKTYCHFITANDRGSSTSDDDYYPLKNYDTFLRGSCEENESKGEINPNVICTTPGS